MTSQALHYPPAQSRPDGGDPRPRVVIVGGGFAGVAAARALRDAPVEVLLIDRRNHQVFQPLLYQVATSVLAPSDIAAPIRHLAHTQPNLRVIQSEVTGIDLAARRLNAVHEALGEQQHDFDYLVLAAGARPSYFGHDAFAAFAPSLKTLADAEEIRSRILSAYESAELTDDPETRRRLLNFVLVGAGPTGVELAASMAQMATNTLRSNFRRIDPAQTEIHLVEGGPRVLPSFDEGLAAKAAAHLQSIGVQIHTGAVVEAIDERGVMVAGDRIESATVIWTAGVEAAPVVKTLSAPKDRAGRVQVTAGLTLPDDPRVFVVGDAAVLASNGRPLPGVAQVALQQGQYAGRAIAAHVEGKGVGAPFRYHDRGNMAVVGKNFALLQTDRVRIAGLASWFVWAFIHIAFLPQVQNRLRVQTQWIVTYLTGQRGARLIPERRGQARAPTP